MVDLHVDGNIARMFGPRDAGKYFARLLQLDPSNIRTTGDPQWPFAFFIFHPPTSRVHHLTIVQGRPAWLLDYVIRHDGTVVQQRIWAPQNETQRHVHVPLNMPIFFVHNDRERTRGLPIVSAAAREPTTLLDTGRPAQVGDCSTTFIRINWPGYGEWSSQIMTRDQTPAHNTITAEKFAKRVASAVCRFMEEQSRVHGGDPRWRIGPGGITRDHVILIGAVHVSQGSWQPILQLNRYVI
ncbi:hypothetical protein EDB89DRAFT_1248870 [Lactarius sanguifluus]|nr:hypothetical protein EDB89DRAFT_1248870 [Lactarius sanguifluus]